MERRLGKHASLLLDESSRKKNIVCPCPANAFDCPVLGRVGNFPCSLQKVDCTVCFLDVVVYFLELRQDRRGRHISAFNGFSESAEVVIDLLKVRD